MTKTSFTVVTIVTILFACLFLLRVTVEPFLVRFARPEVRVSNPHLSEALNFTLDSMSSAGVLVRAKESAGGQPGLPCGRTQGGAYITGCCRVCLFYKIVEHSL